MRKEFELTGHAAGVYDLAPGTANHMVFSASGDGFIATWNILLHRQEPFSIRIGKPVYSLLHDAEGQRLWAGTGHGPLHIVNLKERTEEKLIDLHEKGVFRLMLHPMKRHLYSLGGDGVLCIWEADSLRLLLSYKISEEKLRDAALSPDGRFLAIGGSDGRIRLFETEFYNEIRTWEAHKEGVVSLLFHPQKPILMSGGKDAMLRLWRTDSDFAPFMEIPAHNFSIYDLKISPDHQILATASRDKTIKLWNPATMDALQKMDRPAAGGHTHSVNRLLWVGDKLISAGDDRRIIIWTND
jgi:WD repeat-containing protein 61